MEHSKTPTPGPWRKCRFFTIKNGILDPVKNSIPDPVLVDGFTDGIYNYYRTVKNDIPTWYAIHPQYGLAVGTGRGRKSAQTQALALYAVTEIQIAKGGQMIQSCFNAMQSANNPSNP